MADSKNVALNILLAFKTDKSGVSTAGKAIDDIGKRAQTVGKYASLALTAPLVLFGKQAVDSASELNESMNKVDVVFGKSASTIQAFAKTSAENLGLSKQAALEAAGTFGNLFVAMGIGHEKSADMSTSLLTLASDLASFNDIDPTEALEKLRAGLVGEAEPLRSLGVNLNEAGIQQEALRLGLIKHGQTLTASAKAQAAYSLIMQQTKTAQGDFARTSDGLANSQRRQAAEAANLSAELGTTLLPTVRVLTNEAIGVLKAFNGLSTEQKNTIVVGGLLLAALGPVVGLIGTLVTVVTAAAQIIKVLRIATIAYSAAQWLLNVALSANPIGLVILAVAALAAGMVWAYQNVGWFRDAVNTAWDGLKRFGSWIWSNLKPILDWLGRNLGALGALFLSLASFNVSGVIGALHNLHVPGFAAGGRVPGPEGSPRLILAHGGEQVLTRQQQAAGGVSVTVNIGTYVGDGNKLSKILARELRIAGAF